MSTTMSSTTTMDIEGNLDLFLFILNSPNTIRHGRRARSCRNLSAIVIRKVCKH